MAFFFQAFTSRLTRKYLWIFSLVLIIPTIIIYRFIVSYAQHIMEEHISRDNLIAADAIMKRLNAEITDVVLDKVKTSNLDLVFDKSGNSLNGVPVLMYSRDSVDFTNDVIAVLNKPGRASSPTAEKSPAGSPAAPKKP